MVEVVNNVRNWASILDSNTLLQAERLGRSEVLAGPVALMPDAHVGAGATVGSVIATKQAIIPAAIGVDIGCGMRGVQLELKREDLPEDLSELHKNIERSVPAGFGPQGQWSSGNKAFWGISDRYREWAKVHVPSDRLAFIKGKYGTLNARASMQVGTLGSGNHFVEIGLDDVGYVWIVLHSGSRGTGNALAGHHIAIAKEECKVKGVKLEDQDLAYLVEGTDSFSDYIYDMLWAQEYALFNRHVMMDNVLNQFQRACNIEGRLPIIAEINCHHNFTLRENHFDDNVWLTRKGAIYAEEGEPGIVPGSMATGIFITKGLGNPESYTSSAHGAGRVRSRGDAKRNLNLEGDDGIYTMMEGITWNVGGAKGLMDEHPLAYKDITQVMEDQKDLCAPVTFIRPILNYKGV